MSADDPLHLFIEYGAMRCGAWGSKKLSMGAVRHIYWRPKALAGMAELD